MTGLQWAAVAFLTTGAVATVAGVGKSRKAITSESAAVIVAIDLVLAVLVVLFGGAR